MRLTRILLWAAEPKKPSKSTTTAKQPNPMTEHIWKVSGMTIKDMKKHYSLIPIYGFTVLALFLAGAYVIRLATKHPEVAWTKKTSEPWNEYKNKQYKFLDSGRDYSRGHSGPTFK